MGAGPACPRSVVGPGSAAIRGLHTVISQAEQKGRGSSARGVPGLLVDPSWLRARLGRPGLRPVDLRDAGAYARGHVPGAVHLELAELGTTSAGLENVLLPPDAFNTLMSRIGISGGDVVVAYDDQWGLAAARLVWALHHYGHPEVSVLNGGWDRWREEGGTVATNEESVAPGRFEAEVRPEVSADTAWVARSIEAGGAVLLDTRSRAEFDQGHLPGALLWDWFNAVPAAGWNASRDPEELRTEWHALGLHPSDEVVVYCRSGMRAAHTYLVLRNAGFGQVRLYDGSWQEWAMRAEDVDGR